MSNPTISAAADIEKGFNNLLYKFARADLPAGNNPIWDGAAVAAGSYPGYFTSGQDIQYESDSIEDAVGGGGATSVEIIVQRPTGEEVVLTDLPLNGTVTQTLSANITSELFGDGFVVGYRGRIVDTEDHSEITGPNHGNINFYQSGQTFATGGMMRILQNYGQTFMSNFRCPRNKYGKIKFVNIYPSGGTATQAVIAMKKRKSVIGNLANPPAWNTKMVFDIKTLAGNPVDMPLQGIDRFIGPGEDIIFTALVVGGTLSISVNYGIELFDLDED